MSEPTRTSESPSLYQFLPGDAVRIKDDAFTAFAGREGVIVSPEYEHGFYVRLGVADELWFMRDEVELV